MPRIPKATLGLLLLLAIPIIGLNAQNVSFYVAPGNTWVKIDGKVLELSKQNKLELPAGDYEAEFWGPGFEVEKQIITVKANTPTVIRKGLTKTSVAYDEYKKAKSKYYTKKLNRALIDLSFVGVTVFAANSALQNRKTGPNSTDSNLALLERQIAQTRIIAENAINASLIASSRAEYSALLDQHADEQKSRNQRILLTSSLTALSTGLTTYYFIKWRKKIRKPSLQSDNPFVAAHKPFLTPNISFANTGGQAGFSLTF